MLSVCGLSLRRFCETDHMVAVAQSSLRLGNIFRLTYSMYKIPFFFLEILRCAWEQPWFYKSVS